MSRCLEWSDNKLLTIIIMAIDIIIIGIKVNELSRNKKLEELYDTQGYVRLWNLLEDCTLINRNYPIMGIQIDQKDCSKSFFRYSIQFRDLELLVISSGKYSLELMEQQIKSDYQSAVNKCKDEDLRTVVQRESDREYRRRTEFQEDMDSYFFNTLFDGHSFELRDFAITSPFESYASSGGSYIVDTDYWKPKGDDVIYTGLLEFKSSHSEVVPYAIEKVAKELFPNVNVSRFSDGCFISILRS